MTNLFRNVLAWIFRHFIALVLILIILIAGRYALPPAIDWIGEQAEAARALPEAERAYAEATDRFESWTDTRRAEAVERTRALARAPEPVLRTRRAAIAPALDEARGARLGGAGLALAAARGDGDRIFAHYRAGAEIALLERERHYIDALLAARSVEGRRASLSQRRNAALLAMQAARARWRDANARAETLGARPLAGPRNFLCRNANPAVGCDNYRALVAARAAREAARADFGRARRTVAAIDRTVHALGTARAAADDASAIFEAQRQSLGRQAEAGRRAAAENWILWIRRPIIEMLPSALLILAGIIFSPLILKAILWYLVAPIAGRRRPIVLAPGEGGEALTAGVPSAVSQRIELETGRELLIVPDAVQSIPEDSLRATQWLLDWSMPLSSLASGMVALTRIRLRRPDFILVSATRDPISEIALIRLPEGSAMVLRPRALRGLIKPLGHPVRITRHWRLFSLAAWLTLQFRYLVFHGPCTLIVEGTRGVRLEAAEHGRGINQAATIGFSAGLRYSVRRGEAFGAYLIGKQELFNDAFAGAPGWCLYEEMPRANEGGGLWGRGPRGLADAALKVFGL